MIDGKYTYFAFISYKREDEKWAKWLQRKLEGYGFPVRLRKDNPDLPSKIRPVFRDQSELSGGNLKKEIEKGLEGSKYLVVICSPRAAQSPWVSKEVQYFIDHGKEDSIIPFIIGGTPNAANPEDECFPEGLRKLNGEKEILGININEMGREAAAIKIIARMFGLRFDTLWQRHQRLKRRRSILAIAGVLAFALMSFGVGAYMTYLNTQIAAERDRAENQTILANQERERAVRANSDLAHAKDSIQLQANQLRRAKDSIQLQSNQLALVKDSILQKSNQLAQTNKDLEETNVRLAEETENVKKANVEMQKEQIRMIAEKASDMAEKGERLPALRLITNHLPSSQNPDIPFVPEAMSVMNKLMYELSSDKYKAVDEFKDGGISPDGRWGALTNEGYFYLYDYHNQLLYSLPGYGFTDDSNFYFSPSNDKVYVGCSSTCKAWDINGKVEIHHNLIDSLNTCSDGDLVKLDKFLSELKSQTYSISDILEYNDTVGKLTININKNNYRYWMFPNNEVALIDTVNKKIYFDDEFHNMKTINIKDDTKFYRLNPFFPEILIVEETGFLDVKFYHDNSRYFNDLMPIKNISFFDRSTLGSNCYFLPSGKELVILSGLYSKRHVLSFPTLVIDHLCIIDQSDKLLNNLISLYQDFENEEPTSSSRRLIDQFNNKSLYLCPKNEHSDKSLYFYDSYKGEGTEFVPFVSYSMGNGIRCYHSAYILDDNRILCVAGQGSHMIFDSRSSIKQDFESDELFYEIGASHVEKFVAISHLTKDKSKLYTVSFCGVFSVYDVNSRKLLYSFILPRLFLDSDYELKIERGRDAFSNTGYNLAKVDIDDDSNKINVIYEHDGKYYGYDIQLPSTIELVDHAISELNSFWDDK